MKEPTRRDEMSASQGPRTDSLRDRGFPQWEQAAADAREFRADHRSKFTIVCDEAIAQARERGFYQDGDENLLALEATCFMHMAGDAGRPSDAMRSTARAYLSNPDGFRHDFATSRAHR